MQNSRSAVSISVKLHSQVMTLIMMVCILTIIRLKLSKIGLRLAIVMMCKGLLGLRNSLGSSSTSSVLSHYHSPVCAAQPKRLLGQLTLIMLLKSSSKSYAQHQYYIYMITLCQLNCILMLVRPPYLVFYIIRLTAN